MAATSIFESFVSNQGYVLFEAVGAGEFKLLGAWPDWCRKMWGEAPADGATLRLGDKSAFLDNFLYDAEDFWKTKQSGSISSGNWIEAGESGDSTPLEASAVLIGGQRILIVRHLGKAYVEQQEMYQTARDSLLSHEKLLREILKKEILLHCIVHDLSQPLSAMSGTFHLLSMEPLSSQMKKYVKSGEREAQRQEMMIRGILEAFSSDLAAQQAVGTEPNDVPDVVVSAKRSIEAFENAYRDRGIKLRIDPSVNAAANWRVTGESTRLERIFGNLLENALRYSPKGTTVTINVEDQGEFVRASVNDQGPGLPTDKPQTQLFQLFARGKAHAGKAGLGLYFCKITVERWGGTIGAETRAEGGSRFWFRLPRASVEAQSAAEAAAIRKAKMADAKQAKAAAPAKPLRVLVADDADLNRELVIELLEKQGYTAVGVSDGKKALAALEREPFDAVLMDEEMPNMTGVEATLAIRQKEKGGAKHQFIIGLTGNATAEDERRLLEAGMDAFLTKPIHMQKLFQTVALARLKWDETMRSGGAAAPTEMPMAVNVVTPAVVGASVFSAPRAAADVDIRAQLDKMTGGNEKLARSLVQTLLKDAPKTLAQIEDAVRGKKAEKLASAAHLLKGSLSIFGAPQAVAAARNLQNMGRAGKLASAADELKDLQKAYEDLERELQEMYPTESSTKAAKSIPKKGSALKKTKR
jgi:signal transduction histidine kinase/AmiR/NasT family two-component response regulator/HPt (histidine-containing phosphotransfer) domain-containing protein